MTSEWENGVDWAGDGIHDGDDMQRVFTYANDRQDITTDLSRIGRNITTIGQVENGYENFTVLPLFGGDAEVEATHQQLTDSLIEHFWYRWKSNDPEIRIRWARV